AAVRVVLTAKFRPTTAARREFEDRLAGLEQKRRAACGDRKAARRGRHLGPAATATGGVIIDDPDPEARIAATIYPQDRRRHISALVQGRSLRLASEQITGRLGHADHRAR